MNADVTSSNNDSTDHDTLETFTIACDKNLHGEEHSTTPCTIEAQASSVYVKATEVVMSEEEQKKKGLFGLKFKAMKLVHPVTKRSRTKFICTFDNCGKECENKWSFLDHNRHHTGLRPYECNVCHKRFTQRGNLRQHKQIHKRN